MARTVLLVDAVDNVIETQSSELLFYNTPAVNLVSITGLDNKALVARSDTVLVYPENNGPAALLFPQIEETFILAPAQQGPRGVQGLPGADGGGGWISYVSQWDATPTFLATVAAGDVWQYTYAGGGNLYRLIGQTPYTDAFYSAFDGTDVSELIVQRSMTLP